VSEKTRSIILPNGMKIQEDMLESIAQKEQKIKKSSHLVLKSLKSLGKKKFRVVATSSTKLPSSNTLSRNSDDPSDDIQNNIVLVPGNNKPLQQKEAEVKQIPKSKKRECGCTRKRDNTLLERIEVGCYMKVPQYGRAFKVISINIGGFFLDIPNKPTYYVTNSYAVEHHFFVVPKSLIETLKKECSHPSEIANMLLMHPISESNIIIKASGYNPKDPRPMKKMLVPQIFSERQWAQWLRRFISIQTPEKKQINIVNKQKKLSKTKIQQFEATKKLTENAKKKKDSVKLVGQEGKIISKVIIKPQDFMVKVQTFSCSSKGHTLRSIQAEIICRLYHGKDLTTKLIPVGYCEQCKCYYILSSIYEEYSFYIKNALCDFVNEHDLPKFLQARSLQTKHWRLQSDYKKCGYSVSKELNLKDHERIEILENIIAYRIHSRQEVMSFINWLIDLNKSNPMQIHAIQKWKSDLLEIAHRN